MDQQLFTLHIKAKPTDIPPSVDIDISSLTIGGALHVSDIAIPAGVELETDLDATVVAGNPPRVQVESPRRPRSPRRPSRPPTETDEG